MCLRMVLLSTLVALTGCNQLNLLQPSPTLPDLVAARQRAETAYQNEDWKTAETEYVYLAKNFPGEIEHWFRLGNIYARTNRLDAAGAAYREALSRDAKNSKIWHNLGIVQLRQATNTFIEMQKYTDVNDPLTLRAGHAVNAIGELMESGFAAPGE